MPGHASAHGRHRAGPGAATRIGIALRYHVSAPVVRGTQVAGFVELWFHSREVADRAMRLLWRAVGIGLFWLAVGALGGTLYVRRITRPLGELTRAVEAVRADRLDQALPFLQRAQ